MSVTIFRGSSPTDLSKRLKNRFDDPQTAEFGAIYLVSAVPKSNIETMELVSNWTHLKQKDGTVARLCNYWVLGGVTKRWEHRRTVIMDMRGWVD